MDICSPTSSPLLHKPLQQYESMPSPMDCCEDTLQHILEVRTTIYTILKHILTIQKDPVLHCGYRQFLEQVSIHSTPFCVCTHLYRTLQTRIYCFGSKPNILKPPPSPHLNNSKTKPTESHINSSSTLI